MRDFYFKIKGNLEYFDNITNAYWENNKKSPTDYD